MKITVSAKGVLTAASAPRPIPHVVLRSTLVAPQPTNMERTGIIVNIDIKDLFPVDIFTP